MERLIMRVTFLTTKNRLQFFIEFFWNPNHFAIQIMVSTGWDTFVKGVQKFRAATKPFCGWI